MNWKFILLILLFSAGCSRKNENVKVAVSANARYALEEIVKTYNQQHKSQVEMISGSSGKLTAQIREGAPYHLFLSADMKYPGALFSEKLATDPPKVYAYGELICWSMVLDSLSLEKLSSETIKKIAIASPEVAPYGAAAIEVLTAANIYEEVKEKLVFGENVSQTSQFVLSKSAEAGFTAKSLLLSPEIKEKGVWIELDKSMYKPIAQGVVIVKGNERDKRVLRFYDFLFSEQAKEIFRKYGYTTP